MTDRELAIKAVHLRKRTLEAIFDAGAGHTGGGLSCLDILNVLYNRVLNVSPENFSSPNRDRYVQSKGHSVEALYAGIAAGGKKSFGVSPGCFLTARSLEQIKNDICYSDVPAVLIGISSGTSYGARGTTHHSLHDLAVLRAINNLTILVPADNFESRQAILAAAKATKPVFVRFGKAAMFNLHKPETKFEAGKAITLREGNDVAFIATGETVVHALLAAGHLAEQGLNCRVISMHSIKPLDTEIILKAGRECRAVVTVEEHLVNGGLGEACASVLMQAGVNKPFRIVAIPDEETVPGAQADIFRHYGISMEGLSDVAQKLLK